MSVRTLAALALAVAAVAPARSAVAPPSRALAVSLAVPEHLGRRPVQVGPRAEVFHVVVTNVSRQPVRLWREWCSWGYFNLRLEAQVGGKTFTLAKKPRGWNKNYPDAFTLQPGEHFVIPVVLDPEVWDLPQRRSGPARLRAVYHSTPDRDADEQNVWVGAVASPWLNVAVLDNR
jgi:hypothetical protein